MVFPPIVEKFVPGFLDGIAAVGNTPELSKRYAAIKLLNKLINKFGFKNSLEILECCNTLVFNKILECRRISILTGF